MALVRNKGREIRMRKEEIKDLSVKHYFFDFKKSEATIRNIIWKFCWMAT